MNSPFTKYKEGMTDPSYETLEEFETRSPFNAHHHDHDHEGYEGYSDESEYDEGESYENNDYDMEENPENESYGVVSEAEVADEVLRQATVAKPACKTKVPVLKGRMLWAKRTLNKQLGKALSPDDLLSEEAKKAFGEFQAKNNLPKTLQLDPATERALLEADALQRHAGSVSHPAAVSVIATAKTKIEDWTSRATDNSRGLVLNKYRDPGTLKAVVLHHMAFKRKNRKGQLSDPESYLRTGAHFCIMLDGRIIQLHPVSRMIWHAQCLSGTSVGVEFEGNFPNIQGKWWVSKKSAVPDKDNPTQAQFDSGKFLTSYLKMVIGITNIHAHRQSSASRENDPGPDIWYNVGQWAIDKLGLTDGGSDYKCCSGNSILPQWRTARSTSTLVMPQQYEPEESEFEGDENEWQYESNDDGQWEDEYGSYDRGETYELANVSAAVRANQSYGERLGWRHYFDQINALLLPYSGLSDISLGNEDFARAVYAWQKDQGFSERDCDGIIGPATWRKMEPLVMAKIPAPSRNIVSGGSPPPISHVFEFNQWHADKILRFMSQGIIGYNHGSKVESQSKIQLEKIARGDRALAQSVSPRERIFKILPVIYHIADQARLNNYHDIVIGSFIRGLNEKGKCTGHCVGRCIDINYRQQNNDFEQPGSTQMVINILNYLISLPLQYKSLIGFGMPLQGDFFGHKKFPFDKSVPVSNLINPDLRRLVPMLGYVFPDRVNHLHIQVDWNV